jgi:cAMP-binding proteins - catabolite gene activator and regulatory subunit of cAMP-dependent protein kinases
MDMTNVLSGGTMEKIMDKALLKQYISANRMDQLLEPAILKQSRIFSYKKGEYILEAQSNLEFLCFLVYGKVKVSYLFENGKAMFLKFYQGFHILGDLEFLRDIPVLCDVEAVKDSQVIAIPADLLRGGCGGDAVFLRYLAESLGDKLYATINNSSYNYIYPLINRLSSYILESASDEDTVFLDESFVEISQFLGATYRHLNRTMKDLEQRSIIRCEDKAIHILDRKKLRELSKNLYIQS